jgi:hypothetical protein
LATQVDDTSGAPPGDVSKVPEKGSAALEHRGSACVLDGGARWLSGAGDGASLGGALGWQAKQVATRDAPIVSAIHLMGLLRFRRVGS